MKVAVVGKGGAGKTALSALLVRSFAERGWRVLAVDMDTNPGLAVSLGLIPEDRPLSDEAVEERPKGRDAPYGWALREGLTAEEAVERFATPAGEGIAFVGTGNIGEVDKVPRRYITAVRKIADEFGRRGWALVADLEAGPTTPFEHYARFASPALVAVEPTPASILAARRILGILDHDGTPARVVATKVRTVEDVGAVAQALGPLYARIPYDPALRETEKRGSLWALPEDSCALEAVRILAEKIEAEVGRPYGKAAARESREVAG